MTSIIIKGCSKRGNMAGKTYNSEFFVDEQHACRENLPRNDIFVLPRPCKFDIEPLRLPL
jgi:hypothetical protein